MAANDIVSQRRRPWVRRSYPFQRTVLSDHSDGVFLTALLLLALVCFALILASNQV